MNSLYWTSYLFTATMNTLKVRQQAHLAELKALFASLQYRAFRGEL